MSPRMQVLSLLLGITTILSAAAPGHAQDDSSALVFDGTKHCQFPNQGPKGLLQWVANPRLQFALEGSIEFWLKIDKTTDLSKTPTCLLSVGDNLSNKQLYGIYFDDCGYYVSTDGTPPALRGTRYPFQNQAGAPDDKPVPLDTWQHVVITIAFDPAGLTTQAPSSNRDKQTFCSFHLPPPTGTPQTIVVGSGPNGSNFKGLIGAIRFWDRQLRTEHIQWLETCPNKFDMPVDTCPSKASLLAHLSGTSGTLEGPTMAAPEVVVAPFDSGFSSKGITRLSRRPLGKELKTVWVRFTRDKPKYVDEVSVEYDAPGPWSMQPGADGTNYRASRDIPVVLPGTDTAATYAYAVSRRDSSLEQGGPGANAEIAFRASEYKLQTLGSSAMGSLGVTQLKGSSLFSLTGPQLTDAARQAVEAIRKRDTIWVRDGFALFRPPWTGDGLTDALDTSAPTDPIVGVAVAHDGDVITSLRFFTSTGAMSGVCESTPQGPLPAGHRRPGTKTIELRLPSTYPDDLDDKSLAGKPVAATLEGFVTRRSKRGLHALALAYSFPTNPNRGESTRDAFFVSEGRWINVNGNWKTPVLETAIVPAPDATNDPSAKTKKKRAKDATNYHGNYTSSPIYAFKFNPATGTLTLHRDNIKGPAGYSLLSLDFSKERVADGKATGRWVSPSGDTLAIDREKATVTVTMQKPLAVDDPPTLTLVRPSQSVPTSSSAGPKKKANAGQSANGGAGNTSQQDGWGASFMGDQQISRADTMYQGYDPTKLDPGNYITNIRRNIFKALKKGDMNFYFSNTCNKYMPQGLFYDRRPVARTSEKTWVAKSSHEDQSSWGFDLGQNLGIAGIASFSDSGSYTSEQSTTTKGERLTLRSRCIILDHALIVNRSIMELNDDPNEFVSQILEMRNRMALGETVDWTAFFADFGTHYPYALTYGGLAIGSSTMSETGYATMTGSGFDVKASAEMDVEGVFQAGSNAGYSQKQQDTFESSQDKDSKKTVSYGGSLTKDGGFSSSENEVAPVFLDLRPLYELLSPVYFDDPFVWNDLRASMQAATVQYTADKAKNTPWANGKPVSWASKYPDLLPRKKSLRTFVRSNSQFCLFNKDNSRGVPSTPHDGYNYYYPTIEDNSNVYWKNDDGTYTYHQTQAIWQFTGTNDRPLMSGQQFGINCVEDPGDKTKNQLTMLQGGVAYEDYGSTDTRTQFVIEIVGDPPGSVRGIPYGTPVRIRNVYYNEYLSNYSNEYFWGVSSGTGDETIWTIWPVGVDPNNPENHDPDRAPSSKNTPK